MRKSVLEQLIACEQAPGWVQGEIAECSLGERDWPRAVL